MEPIQGTRKASESGAEDLDFISNMPDIVVTSILDRLPIKDAVRTSALSKNWRFKWTTLSQLVFDRDFFLFLIKTRGEKNNGRIISRLLFNLKGAVTKFVLYIYIKDLFDDNDISQWLLFLSTKGVKDLTIFKWTGDQLELPSHVFSCLTLKRLELYNCCFDLPASFCGFPKLLSLKLGLVEFKRRNFGDLITQCPVIEILDLGVIHHAKVKVVEIAKLTNLEILSLRVRKLDNTCSGCIFELLGCLPKLQELKLNFKGCKSFSDDDARKRFYNTFPCLKSLELSCLDLENDIRLSFAFEIIRSSPNLKTLEITSRERHGEAQLATGFSEVDYHTIQLLELQSVVLRELKGSKNELSLVKFILACSPFLKEIVIHPRQFLKPNEKSMLSRKMLKLHSAFSCVEIRLCEF